MKAGIFKQDPFATLDQAGVGQLVQMATDQGPRHSPQHQGGHLRRTWRRSRVRQVLPPRRAQLRLLLALPSAGCPPGRRAGSAGREVRAERSAAQRRLRNAVIAPDRSDNAAVDRTLVNGGLVFPPVILSRSSEYPSRIPFLVACLVSRPEHTEESQSPYCLVVFASA